MFWVVCRVLVLDIAAWVLGGFKMVAMVSFGVVKVF